MEKEKQVVPYEKCLIKAIKNIVLRGDDMNEFSDFELQLLSEILDTLIVFDDNSYCPVDNLEGIKEKIDFELTIRGY